MKSKWLGQLFLALAVATLVGCGGGGGSSTPPTRAIVKLSTSGTLPQNRSIEAVQATLTYPVTKGLTVTSAVTSGFGGGIFQSNDTVAGQVTLAMAVSPGILAGEFATLTFNIAAGNTPVTGDFTIAPGAQIIDSAGALPGMSVIVSSVQFQ